MQSPSSILYDRITLNVAEADPGAAELSLLDVSSPAPRQEGGVALEVRWPNADPSERLPVYPKAPLKGPVSGRSGRMARFAREALKTAATLLILVLAVLAAVVICDSYVTEPSTRHVIVLVQFVIIATQV